jgi:hypothetical protein
VHWPWIGFALACLAVASLLTQLARRARLRPAPAR